MVQNLSFPRPSTSHKLNTPSINSFIESNDYPCTWGTFNVVCRTIWDLPPGSEGACRDVAEAYRNIPLHPSQWPGLVVQISPDVFAIDTCICFGLSSAGGVYGSMGDAAVDIFRAHGIGPVSKWVDDHVFFRVPRNLLNDYNYTRGKSCEHIKAEGGRRHDRGRIWYAGKRLPNGKIEEFDNDLSATIKDLPHQSDRAEHDKMFTYNLDDVNRISDELGIPWELSKDVPFAPIVPFIGFHWDVQKRSVSLPQPKKDKYLGAIHEWNKSRTHTLPELRKLYGKLLHSSLIIPEGRAYLTSLEKMMGVFHRNQFVPHTPPRNTPEDIQWWISALSRPTLERPILGPRTFIDLAAFSDASTGIGIGIVIGNHWRAWNLTPGWNLDKQREIGWAEAVGFEFLILTLVKLGNPHSHIKVYGDNIGVVEGWWKGRSRNTATNVVFKRIHKICEANKLEILTEHVAGTSNPADDPSRGIYPSHSKLLPQITIPGPLLPYISDFDKPQRQKIVTIASTDTGATEPNAAGDSEFKETQKLEYEIFRNHCPWRED